MMGQVRIVLAGRLDLNRNLGRQALCKRKKWKVASSDIETIMSSLVGKPD